VIWGVLNRGAFEEAAHCDFDAFEVNFGRIVRGGVD
jgi:hypothetical protein